MDTRTGEIITAEEAEGLNRKFGRGTAIEMDISPTRKQAKQKKVGRNDPCPCGSGKKFKKCHLRWQAPEHVDKFSLTPAPSLANTSVLQPPVVPDEPGDYHQ